MTCCPKLDFDAGNILTYFPRTEAMLQWQKIALELPKTGCPYSKQGGREEAYWRTLIADANNGHRAGSQEYEDFKLWMGQSSPEYAESEESTAMKSFFSSIITALDGRTAFISSHGHMGLVPDYAEPGDLICVLFGGAAPLVLREEGDNYILVGECYCHGIMDGEAMQDFEKGILEARDFTLV
jgi:hypothetical protein